MAGACQTVCPSGQSACGGSCRELNNDRAHCGRCDNACPTPANGAAFCAAGTCDARCNAGFGDCDSVNGNGCETNLATSVLHCGACGRACSFSNAAAGCANGACQLGACSMGFGDCNANPADGCETSLGTSSTHCGACGRSCGTGEVCSNGVCTVTCAQGLSLCNNACTNLSFDPANCGACGNVCPTRTNTRAACAARTCATVCNAGFGDCNGNPNDGCEVSLTNTVAHCGACGAACPTRSNATPVCADGACGILCATGFADCDNNPGNGCESNPQSDSNNCGACGNACATGRLCLNGQCSTFGALRSLSGTHNASVSRGSTHNGFFQDTVTGRYYWAQGYSDQTQMIEFANFDDFSSNRNGRTITLQLPYDGTYHVAINGFIYYARANSNTLVRARASDGQSVATASLSGAGFRNTAAWDWGGYSDIDLYVDVGNTLWVAYANARGSNLLLSQLDPTSLAVLTTHTIPVPKTNMGWGILINGEYYLGDDFNRPTFNTRYTLSTRTTSSYSNSFTPVSNEYITTVSWSPTSRELFVQTNGMVYRYQNVP